MRAQLTVSLKDATLFRKRHDPLGTYVVAAEPESLDAFVDEVQSHGCIYDASWRPITEREDAGGEAVSFEAIRADLSWLFED